MSRPETITSEYVRGFRAGESSALERAAHALAPFINARGEWASLAHPIEIVRALASPAAAHAAEECPEPPPGLIETLEKVHGMGCGNIATHRIPAPPSAVAPSLLPRAATTDKVRIAQLNTQLDNAEKRIAELEAALRALTSVNRAVSEVEGLAAARSEGET